MSWQNVAIFGILVAAVLVGPKLGVDPTLIGTLTTVGAALFVNRKPKSEPSEPGEPS